MHILLSEKYTVREDNGKGGVILDKNALLTYLEQNNIPYETDVRMARHTTFAIGGAAGCFAIPQTEEQLIAVVHFADKMGIRVVVLGRGSNVLFADAPFDGIVISVTALRRLRRFENVDGNCLIEAQCGVSLRELACYAAKKALPGLEFAHGIPGTVGGAIRMNAGAYGGEMGKITQSVRCYHRLHDEIVTYSCEEFAFSHRHSLLTDKSELICLSATFALPMTNEQEKDIVSEQIFARMEDLKLRRRLSQPLEYPSAGSVFKRPNGHFAGKLIEDCGWKGKMVGGAQVSQKHAGFIINRGGATAQDVLTLISRIKQSVLDAYGVTLEEEIIYME